MVNCCVCWKEPSPLVFRQFHRFPTNTERRQKWFNSIGRNITAYKNATICSDHFTEEDYYYCGTPVHGRRLQKTAIPSVLLQRSRKNFEQPSTSCNIENVNPQDSIMDIQHKSTVNNEQSTRDIQQDIVCAKPILVKENVNPQESIMDIQHKSTVNNEQSTRDIQQDIICAEPTLVKENVNPQKLIMDIQHKSTVNNEQSTRDIQQDIGCTAKRNRPIICAEPTLVKENGNPQESIINIQHKSTVNNEQSTRNIQQDIICAEPTLVKENVNPQKSKMDIQHKSTVNNEQSTRDIEQDIICAKPTLVKENVNPQKSIINIQHKSTVNNEQSTRDIQQDIICAEPTLVKENVTNRKRKRHFCEKKRVFIQTDKDSKALIRKTDFVNVEAWNKFIKFLNYSRHMHKRSVKQLHLKKKNVTVKSAEEMLKTKNLVTKGILGALKVS